jgi:pimeloyl-ACP methyl ester carboxylesterase
MWSIIILGSTATIRGRAMTCTAPVALRWQINGLQIAGLSWGEPGGKPLLMLHGWLDNAASFSMLAPLLADYHVVALDLTGHGLSDKRSADAGYQIWDDLPEILGVLDALGWDQFDLLGHSRGAIISTLLASTVPERVQQLVLLDALSPQPIADAEFPGQMRKFLQDKKRLLQREPRIFATLDQAVTARRERGLPQVAAQLIVERNLRASGNGFTWTTDARLHGASAAKLTAAQNRAVFEALTMPTLLLLADEGVGRHQEAVDAARASVGDLLVEQVVGGHHFHMEPGVDAVAERIRRFLQ